MKPLELRGESDLLGHFAHIRLAPMVADPTIIVTAGADCVWVRVEIPIYDRHDGSRWSVSTEQPMGRHGFSGAQGNPRSVAEETVRRCLVQALAHEVDECLRGADGALLRDPHAPPVKP